MATSGIEVRMTPSHPGDFIRLLRMQAWYDASQTRARAGEISVRRYQPA